MTHPIIPLVIEIATPIADSLDLEIVGAIFQTSHNPPVLRVDIRNRHQHTGLDDCEQMSRALETALDQAQILPESSYVLEISSPGISRKLSTDREFISFKGFAVLIQTQPPFEGQQQWRGGLIGRDETNVYINQKGRSFAIPKELVISVQLD